MLKRLSFCYLCLIIAGLLQAPPCQAKVIPVELVWKFKQAGWVKIEVADGEYQLKLNSITQAFPAGSVLQLGWGGWTPVIRINQEELQVVGDSILALEEVNPGSLRLRTPQDKEGVYRGSLQVSWQRGGWQLVNLVDSEDYLKGVVPIEMSNDWAGGGFEALKAQAVAARTYLVKHSEDGKKMITDSPDIDQAYGGKSVEGEASKAVEATKGKILVDTDSGQPINALYSSHNGGYAEDAKNVWGSSDIHNVSHDDPFSDGIGGAENRWTFMVSAPVLGATFGIGPVKSIKLEKYSSGRVKRVWMKDWFGSSLTVTGRSFVKAFYPFGQPIQKDAFLGSLFNVQVVSTGKDLSKISALKNCLDYPKLMLNADEGFTSAQGPLLAKILSTSLGVSQRTQPFGIFIFEGRGWGHGVGMSQWGAYHMSQLGYNYIDILGFYYHNSHIAEFNR
jgi:stage II sporulation protein D